MYSRLAHYLETGELPYNRYLTEAQRLEVLHANADESTAEIATRIGADYFLVMRYRARNRGVVSTPIYYRECAYCGDVFVTRRSNKFMHTDCRQRLDIQWEWTRAA